MSTRIGPISGGTPTSWLSTAHLKQGLLLGHLERRGFHLRLEAELQATTEEAVKNAEIGREKVHFQAPPAERVEAEMQAFIGWFNAPLATDGILHATIAHLWFVTFHPFDDSNGRIARALADMSLALSENSPQRFYSLSSQIRRDRSGHYGSLECTQKGDPDITVRLLWFAECFSKTTDEADRTRAAVFQKAEFWERHAFTVFNEHQRSMLNRLQDRFEGKLTSRKWAATTKCCLPTAQRDIKELIDQGILLRNEGGSKNTGYRVAGP